LKKKKIMEEATDEYAMDEQLDELDHTVMTHEEKDRERAHRLTEKLKMRLNEYYDLDMDRHGHSYQGRQVKKMALNLGERQEKAAREFQVA